MKKVRVEINVPGVGDEAHEYEFCPISIYGHGRCLFIEKECKFGLTEIAPPPICPMRINFLNMRFSVVGTNPPENPDS